MEQFGKYTLIRKIGTGGMAEVFLARTTVAQGLNKTLVIKKIHTAYAKSRPFVAMFIDEAKIALGLNHPNITQVFDFGAVADTYFLAMEYVDGIDLLRLLQDAARARQRLPYGVSGYIVQQVAKGLDYAHRKADEFGQPLGIVHRDVSPQNILLSWDGSVKIVDFGIARARNVHEEEGVIKGKYAYMSPEQARGEPVDCRSDVFAAGIVLYELVCARPLFHGKTSRSARDGGKDSLELVKSGVIPHPREFAPELPESLERIILRALAFRPSDRFATARELQHELGKFQLEWGQRIGTLVDSGALAHMLAQLVPDGRAVDAAPPAADAVHPTGARGTPSDSELGASSGPGDSDVGEPSEHYTPGGRTISSPGSAPGSGGDVRPTVAPARDTRERKYVYVLEGALRGMAALERRLGSAGAARLVAEFYQVARDVAFKHDALLDVPRLPGDAEPSAAARGGLVAPPTAGYEATLRVVVGLPVSSEDDAGRAIRLALALVDALDGIGSDVEPELRLALAVQRGVALVRRTPPGKHGASDVGSGRAPALAYEIDDATAAFAHRLAQKARGAEILVGGRLFRAARADWTFEPLPAIDLPDEPPSGATGKLGVDDDTDPGIKRARIYRLRGPKERAARLREHRDAGRLYGRDLELKALRDTWRDVLVTRTKRQIVLVGDAGVGKRTLVRTFLDGIQPSEAVVIRTAARVGAALTPYAMLADVARDMLGLPEDAEPHEVERQLVRTLPLLYPGDEGSREARTALAILGMLLGGRNAAPVAEVDAQTRRQVLIRLIARVEQRLESDKPLVLFAEDIHWADQDSQELFAALLKVRSQRPILGVMTSRPEPRTLRLAKDLGSEIVLLDELPPAARRDMVADRLVPGPDVDELVEQIAARCGGNAFFIQELLDTLVERGVLVPETDAGPGRPGLLRWVKRDAPIQVPSTVEDLILSRIDALPAAERDTLVHAAVLGRDVPAATLSQLLGRPVRLELDDLVRRGLLSPRPETDEYRFKNDMTMTVAYGLIPPDTRVQMHRSVAARIAGAAGYRAGQDDALIARNLELAGDQLAAADRYLRAAGHAIEIGGNADAFRQLARALKLLPDDDHARRFTTHRLREEILRRLARRPQQLRELHALRKAAEQLGDPARLATAHCALAQFYIDVGKAPAALRAAIPALSYAREARDPLLEAEVIRLRAAIARLVGNAEESLRLVEQALALCDRSAPGVGRAPAPVLTARATILSQRGTTLWNIGRLEAAIESYAEALVIYRALGMGRQEARALGDMGVVFGALGEYEEALAHHKSALKLDQTLGDRSHIAQKLGNIGQCYADLGDLDRAERYLEKALKLAEQTGDLVAAGEAAVSLGQARLARGDGAAALALFERGLRLATENRDRYQEIRALQYIALAHLVLGHPPDTALEIARSATEWARKMPMLVGIVYGLTFQGVALSRLGRHDEAIACVDDAVQRLDGARPDGAEHVHHWRAEVLAAAGRHAAARAARDRASAEIAAKSTKLRDPELRALYLASRQPPR